MSNDSIKRPLRVLPGAGDSLRRPTRVEAASDNSNSAEWFRLLIFGAPNTKGDSAKPSPTDVGEREAPASALAEAATQPEEAPAPKAATPLPAPRAAVERSSSSPAESLQTRKPAERKFDYSGSGGQAQDQLAEQMASLIGGLCSRADPAFQSWTATLRLDPNVLPDTQLRLSLSPHWLSLRFITESTAATRLVSTHQAELQSLLESAPNLPHCIDIDIA